MVEVLGVDDYEALIALLPELYKFRDLGELAQVMLRITGLLIPNLMCTYNEMDFRTGAVVAAYQPESMRGPMEAIMPELSESVNQHPIYQKAFRTGEGHPQFLSDYLSVEEALQHPFVRTAEKHLNVRDHLLFSLQNSHQRWIFIAVSRAQRDFSERDRAMAGLLRTHFSAAYENAIAFTETRAKALILDRVIDTDDHGIVLFDEAGRVLHMNAAFFKLMERYFPEQRGWKATLPPTIKQWLSNQVSDPLAVTAPFIIEAEKTRLVVRTSPMEGQRRIVMFREEKQKDGPGILRSLGLSERQAEVLFWMSEGKSNSEVGIILSISTRTVEKHLEMIYEKLQIETRAAAMLAAHRLLNKE